MNETILIIILLFVIVTFIYLHLKEVKYIESKSGTKYLVRNLKDSKKAADMLQEIVDKLKYLINYIISHKSYYKDINKQYIDTINQRFDSIVFRESTSKNKYTSYSVNKGEEIVVCLRSKKTHELHNINEILYVVIHEIAHVGCPEIGHTPLFNQINKRLLEYAVECGVYQYKDYDRKPEEYCGIEINTNLLSSYLYSNISNKK